MNLKKLMFLAAMTAKPQEENLLDYSDLVNKNYGGSANAYNVRTEGVINVKPGASMVLTGLQVDQLNVRFYDKDGNYNNQSVVKYNIETPVVEFTVPDDCYSLRPKWYRVETELPVSEVVASNPVIKYI